MKGIGRFRFKRQDTDDVVTVRVVVTPLRVMVQLVVKRPDAQPNPQPPLGIDVGITARVTLSDGTRWTKCELDRERITVLQQRVSAAKKGSRNRRKRARELSKEWRRAVERERGMLHEMTADLVKKTNCYFVEDLPVQKMMQNHGLARSIAEQQWATFLAMLTYKAESAGGWVRKVDPKYTSQDCSRCGTRVKKTLSDRLYACSVCGLSIDRDWNAAINILRRGLHDLSPGGNIPGGVSGTKNSPPVNAGWSFPLRWWKHRSLRLRALEIALACGIKRLRGGLQEWSRRRPRGCWSAGRLGHAPEPRA